MGNLIKNLSVGEQNAFMEGLDAHGVTVDDIRRALSHNRVFCKDLAALLRSDRELAPLPAWVTPMTEVEIPPHLAEIHTKWIRFAKEIFGYEGPVAFKVKGGFNWRKHGPSFGPCYEKWSYAKEWNLKDDECTTDAIVFWVPARLPDSTSKIVVEQRRLLASLREKYELPGHHLASFGSVSLSAALILGHYASTKERIPMDRLYVRTDTFGADGRRLNLGSFGVTGLYCNDWYCDGSRHDHLGCVALGVEKA